MRTALKAQPAAISAALVAVLNALVLLGEVRLDAEAVTVDRATATSGSR